MLHSIGEDGRLLAVNDHWLRVMGYERGEVLGRLVTEFVAEESRPGVLAAIARLRETGKIIDRSEEHTSELQSPCNLVCRLLLEKKKKHNGRRRRHSRR